MPTDRSGITLTAPVPAAAAFVVSPPALEFVAALQRRFSARITERLAARADRDRAWAAGVRPHFLPETASIRSATWTVAPLPADLLDRRVEITGPVDRKMVINALNSGAKTFMADFEDSNTPTWDNQLLGQANLYDAVRRTITWVAPDTGKPYRLGATPAVLLVRPRGLHLPERHLRVDDAIVRGALFDFGLFCFHNAVELVARGSGPYFYLPKLESHLEARIWDEVFTFTEQTLGLRHGTIKATVLIETLPAAFEMDEILHELRAHSAGLNCGRWDYIFSFIKKLGADPAHVFPDRSQVGMDRAFLRAYSRLLIRTCHRRGVHAMGGMAPQIPIKGDPEANDVALARVRADKLREVTDGHDGTWVAHPALVPIAQTIFDAQMPGPNQIDRVLPALTVTEADLLEVHTGPRTEATFRHNIRVGVQYIEAWLRGSGCVPLYNLMEDAATAEICRSQNWQWIRHRVTLDTGRTCTPALLAALTDEEMARVHTEIGETRFAAGRFIEARRLFERLCTAPEFVEFLTLPAYELL